LAVKRKTSCSTRWHERD